MTDSIARSMPDSAARVAGALAAGSSLLAAEGIPAVLPADIGTTAQSALVQSPLGRACQRAIRRAVDDLRSQYPHTGNACTLLQSFDLVAACASSIPMAELPQPLTLTAIQAALVGDLNRLLLGYDEQEIAFLQAHLLPTTARALRAEIAADPTIRRALQAWLSEPRFAE